MPGFALSFQETFEVSLECKALKTCLVLGGIMLSACGVGQVPVSPLPSAPEGEVEVGDQAGPRLLEVFPADAATEVPVTSLISASFDEEILPDSVSSLTLRLFRKGLPVPGKVMVSGNRLIFLPSASLDYDSDFEVVLGVGLSDISGNSIPEEQRWYFRSQTFSSDLPIVRVDTLGELILDDPKIPARMTISEPGGGSDYEGWIGIEIRGSSTQAARKKQFGFETRDEAEEEIDASLLGMPEESDWILQANAFDPTLLRNYFALELSRATGRYAPRTRFTELFLAFPEGDFHYWGVYALMEKIKRDANRVSLKKLGPADNAEPEVTGGYMLAMDKVHEGDLFFDTARGTRLLYEYPKGDDITPAQAAWILGYLDDFEASLYGPDFRDPVAGYRAFLDLDSAVDYFLVNEALKNIDAFSFSTFFSKERGEKIKMGPVWDFDLAMANYFSDPRAAAPEGWLLCERRWVERWKEDPDFVAAVAARFHALRAGPWSDAAVEALLDGALEELGAASGRNMTRWYRDLETSYEGEVAVLRAWLLERLAWMDSHIEDLCGM